MNIPLISYYALFAETTAAGRKTPKYTIVKSAGYYPPMAKLTGRDGKISMYLMEKLKEGLGIPAVRLQAKDNESGLSYNFTGLKEWFDDGGKLTGFAYGYPLNDKTYSKEHKPNPFYNFKADGYLFKVHPNADCSKPLQIELMVLPNAKPIIAGYCKMLEQGGFDEDLLLLRQQAK